MQPVSQDIRIDGPAARPGGVPAGPLLAALIAPAGAQDIVVIVPGSGPTDRDGNAPVSGLASDSYRLLAEGLAAQGVASVRIDKRGLFGSAAAVADPNDVTIAAYAADARRWVDRAAQVAPRVWLAGHSEGGLVALAAASDPPAALCGILLLATPGRPPGELLLDQMRAAGKCPADRGRGTGCGRPAGRAAGRSGRSGAPAARRLSVGCAGVSD